MDYEKEYKKLKAGIKNAYLYALTDSTKEVLENILPELKESEDELTWLTKYIEEEAYNLSMDIRDSEDRIKLKKLQKSLAWLEKQELKSNPYSGVSFSYNGNIWGMCARDNGVDILFNKKLIQHISGEKQGEQKLPIEKLPEEMKSIGESLGFTTQEECDEYNQMVSDIIMSDEQDCDNIDHNFGKHINKVEPKFKVGDLIRLKDGYGLEWTVEEVLNNGYYTIVCADRDAFIQLDDKWELVEQKPADWSEEDEKMLDSIIYHFSKGHASTIGQDAWLKSLKNRVQPQQKQEWSEEDEKMIGRIRSMIEAYAFSQSAVDVNGDLCEKKFIDVDIWLKSLKERIGE